MATAGAADPAGAGMEEEAGVVGTAAVAAATGTNHERPRRSLVEVPPKIVVGPLRPGHRICTAHQDQLWDGGRFSRQGECVHAERVAVRWMGGNRCDNAVWRVLGHSCYQGTCS